MSAYRIGYSIAAVITWAAWLVMPVRVLLFESIPASDRGDGMRTAAWIMLVFLGSLAAVFTFRAVRGRASK